MPYYKGATIRLLATFRDSNNQLVTPDSAEITITSKHSGVSGDQVKDMVHGTAPGTYVYDWDSSDADAGVVNCKVVALAGDLVSVGRMQFQVTA